MQISIKFHSDGITPDLRRRLRRAANPQPALEAAGLVIESFAKRAFDEPALRPAPWRPLKPKTIRAKQRRGLSSAILKAHTVLARSPRITQLSKSSVTIGTNLFYAAFHQLGTRRIPARPFFPFTPAGGVTPKAKERVNAALRKKLDTP